MLHALHLQQEAVLAIEVHRRGRGRAGDEQISRALGHAALAFGHELLHFVEALVDQLRVFRRLLDVSKRHPRPGALDVPDRSGMAVPRHVDVIAVVCEGQVSHARAEPIRVAAGPRVRR